jgi:RNA exonuclease 1
VPGLTPEHLSLPPLPTSATENPHMPLAIPDPTDDCVLPFVSQTFSHACPTRAPGDAFRMHSIMSEFFTGPVVGEEKKRRQDARVKCRSFFSSQPALCR